MPDIDYDLSTIDSDAFCAITPKILYFGTPVVLISTLNEDGTPNLAPMSSAWALGYTVALGLGNGSQTLKNLSRSGECVLNLPSDDLWQAVERLAPLTGNEDMPEYKRGSFRYESAKFRASGLTPLASTEVAPPRVAECQLQLEASVQSISPLGAADDSLASLIQVRVIRIHAHKDIVHGEHHVDPARWHPLIYNFRHYFGLGSELGKTFRAEI